MNRKPFAFRKLYYIDSTSYAAPSILASHLRNFLKDSTYTSLSPIFICIGTDRIIGDSLGPMIGSMLHENKFFPYTVYGTLSHPIHALNLRRSVEFIQSLHPENPLIAIDASLGSSKHLQYITVSKSALSPGSGVCKSLTSVGDISITGIISESGKDAFLSLQTVRLSKVVALSSCITRGILLACNV